MKKAIRKSKEKNEPREKEVRARAVGVSVSGPPREVGTAEMSVEFSNLPTTIMSSPILSGATVLLLLLLVQPHMTEVPIAP